MISIQQAYKRISGLAADQVCELTKRRILSEDTVPVGEGYFGEPCEDLVIQLLRNKDLPEGTRRDVVSACELVYARLLAWLAAPSRADADCKLDHVATRLCRVVDVAEPDELRGHADAMLNLALSAADLPPGVLPAAVRASMAFGCTPDHIPLWVCVLRHPEVAGYAFNALLEIDPHADRIKEALITLWPRQLRERWNVDTAFLMRRAARAQGSEAIIEQVLSALEGEEALQARKLCNIAVSTERQHIASPP